MVFIGISCARIDTTHIYVNTTTQCMFLFQCNIYIAIIFIDYYIWVYDMCPNKQTNCGSFYKYNYFLPPDIINRNIFNVVTQHVYICWAEINEYCIVSCLSNFRLYYTNTHTIESYDLINGERLSYGHQSQNTFISVALYKVKRP